MATNEPQQLQDNAQLVGDQQIGTSGVFEQESLQVGNYKYITTAATNTIKSGPGALLQVIVGKATTGTVTIYDNTAASGTIIAAFPTSTSQFSYTVGAIFNIGLTVVNSAGEQLTVIYV